MRVYPVSYTSTEYFDYRIAGLNPIGTVTFITVARRTTITFFNNAVEAEPKWPNTGNQQ